jgi:short-subunit dehydrogenase
LRSVSGRLTIDAVSSATSRAAVITGASSGIGAEFARRAERLADLAGELRERYGVAASPVPLDLAAPGPGEALRAALAERGIAVSALVNCAGFGRAGRFADASPEDIAGQVAVNVAALVDLTRTFYPGLRAAEGGVLINVASVMGFGPVPGMAVYAAAKAFVISFTEALWAESRGTGLRVLCLAPGATRTEFFGVAGAPFPGGAASHPPRLVVSAAFRGLRSGRRPTVVPGRLYPLAAVLMRMAPRRALLAAGRQVQRYAARG